jgi:hypothetical protein
MRRVFLKLLVLAALIALPATALAQFGHPMKGQWSGQWGKDNQRLLLDLDWDGKNIVGSINPGANAAKIVSANVVYTDAPAGKWNVKLTAEGTVDGKPVKIEVDGILENIGAYYRVYHGTWTQNGVKGEFTVTRN